MSLPVPAEDPAHELSDVVDRPVLRVAGPSEIVQLVPYILGFHPDDSLVLIALRGRRVVASARNDIDAPLEMITPWCTAATRAGADSVVAALYIDDVSGQPLPRLSYVADLVGVFQAHDLSIVDVLAVSDGRWWSYQCSEPACCPPDGTPIDHAGAIAASAVSEGLVALRTREDLRNELAIDTLAVNLVAAEVEARAMGLDGTREDPVAERQWRAQAWKVVRQFVKRAGTTSAISPAVAADVLAALTDKHVRDATLGYLVNRPDPAVRDAWRRLATIAPESLRGAPATLYAMWCYASGEGARSNVGVDVALAADPDYTMAHLLLELQMTGLNPFEVVHDMGREAAKVGRRIQRQRRPIPLR